MPFCGTINSWLQEFLLILFKVANLMRSQNNTYSLFSSYCVCVTLGKMGRVLLFPQSIALFNWDTKAVLLMSLSFSIAAIKIAPLASVLSLAQIPIFETGGAQDTILVSLFPFISSRILQNVDKTLLITSAPVQINSASLP